jgi:hypothetical protein
MPRSDKHDVVSMFEEALGDDPTRFRTLPGVTANWPPQKLVRLWQLAEDGKTQDEIAPEFGVDRSTISRKLGSMDWDNFIAEVRRLCEMSREEFLDYAADKQRVQYGEKRCASAQLKQINILASLKNFEERLVREAAKAPRIVLPDVTVNRGLRSGGHSTPEEMVLLLSDAHVGLGVTKAETGGLGEYNTDMFLRRAANLRKGLIEIYGLHSKLYRLPKLHIMCLGDMVQGGNLNGEWGPANIILPLDQQVVIAANAVSELMLAWEPLFDQITFTGVVGNHGRGGASKNSDKVSANWDNMVYAIIEARLAEQKKMKVVRSHSWWAQKNVNGTEILIVHGDHTSSNASALKGEEAKYQSLVTDVTGKWFNVMCVGHFHNHQEMETPKGMMLVNGSFIGGDVHSAQHLKTRSRPTQTLFGVHPERGLTWKYRLDMDLRRD